jgi:hypothetical protein
LAPDRWWIEAIPGDVRRPRHIEQQSRLQPALLKYVEQEISKNIFV